MIQLAYMLMTISNHQNSHVADAQVERRFFIERYAEFRQTIDSLFNNASRDLWKCNPNPYLDSRKFYKILLALIQKFQILLFQWEPFFVAFFIDNYYTSITNFMQGYIDNEVNMNEEHSCSGQCNDFKSTKNNGCRNETLCAHSNFAKTRCGGEIFDCTTIDSDGVACLVVCFIFYVTSRFMIISTRIFFQHFRRMNGKIDDITM